MCKDFACPEFYSVQLIFHLVQHLFSISSDDNTNKTYNALTMDFMAVSMCKICEGLLKEY